MRTLLMILGGWLAAGAITTYLFTRVFGYGHPSMVRTAAVRAPRYAPRKWSLVPIAMAGVVAVLALDLKPTQPAPQAVALLDPPVVSVVSVPAAEPDAPRLRATSTRLARRPRRATRPAVARPAARAVAVRSAAPVRQFVAVRRAAAVPARRNTASRPRPTARRTPAMAPALAPAQAHVASAAPEPTPAAKNDHKGGPPDHAQANGHDKKDDGSDGNGNGKH